MPFVSGRNKEDPAWDCTPPMWLFVLSGSLYKNDGMAMSSGGDMGAACVTFGVATSVWLTPEAFGMVYSTQALELWDNSKPQG